MVWVVTVRMTVIPIPFLTLVIWITPVVAPLVVGVPALRISLALVRHRPCNAQVLEILF